MNERKVRFRNALSGYNKDDVNAFIEEMNADSVKSEEELRGKISDLEGRLKKMETEELAEKDRQLEALAEKLENAERLIAEMTDSAQRVNEEKEGLERQISEMAVRISELEAGEDSRAEIIEKSGKYDRVSEQIGNMIVNANARAESIVSEAELKARVASRAMIDATVERLSVLNEKYTGDIIAKTVQLTEQMRGLSLEAESFRTGINSAVEAEGTRMKESLEATKRVITEENNG